MLCAKTSKNHVGHLSPHQLHSLCEQQALEMLGGLDFAADEVQGGSPKPLLPLMSGLDCHRSYMVRALRHLQHEVDECRFSIDAEVAAAFADSTWEQTCASQALWPLGYKFVPDRDGPCQVGNIRIWLDRYEKDLSHVQLSEITSEAYRFLIFFCLLQIGLELRQTLMLGLAIRHIPGRRVRNALG